MKNFRRVWHEDKWWFVVNDVVEVLTDTPNAFDYIKKVRKRDEELAKGWGQIVTSLSVTTEGGKQRISCANIKGLFRLIMSIPSPNAEHF